MLERVEKKEGSGMRRSEEEERSGSMLGQEWRGEERWKKHDPIQKWMIAHSNRRMEDKVDETYRE